MVITPEIKPKWNAIITDILRAFVEICNEHGLHYFCVGGTAIGAVRHGGMIPWDDDIDVCMPRPDYERFVEVFNAMDSPDYELVTPYSQDNYPLPSMKLCNKKTTLMEDEHTPALRKLRWKDRTEYSIKALTDADKEVECLYEYPQRDSLSKSNLLS